MPRPHHLEIEQAFEDDPHGEGVTTLPSLEILPTVVEAAVQEMPQVTTPPSMDEAFTALCQALTAHVPGDATAMRVRIAELARTYTDGNRLFAWREVFKLLEDAQRLAGL